MHLRCRPLGDLLPPVEHDHGIAEPHDERHVVLDDEEGEALGVQPADVALDRLHQHRIDTRRRLVQQDDRGPAHQRRCELEQLALPERELRGRYVRVPGEVEVCEELFAPSALGRLNAPA